MKLNLGSGCVEIEGYRNLDGNNGDTIYPLEYENVDVIRASHVLEHFGRVESVEVLRNWIGCLKQDGLLKIAVPSLPLVMEQAQVDNSIASYLEMIIMGGQIDEYDYHKSLWDEDKLRYIMEREGLADIQHWQSEIHDCASYPFSVNLQGVKA